MQKTISAVNFWIIHGLLSVKNKITWKDKDKWSDLEHLRTALLVYIREEFMA